MKPAARASLASLFQGQRMSEANTEAHALPWATTSYEADQDAALRAVLPSRCVYATREQTCAIFVDHYRERKSGPCHPVAVVGVPLSEYFKDADPKLYNVANSNSGVVAASVAEGVLTLAPVLLSHGTALVVVTPKNATGTGPAHYINLTVQARPALKTNMKFEAVNLVRKPGDAGDTQANLLREGDGKPVIKMYDLKRFRRRSRQDQAD